MEKNQPSPAAPGHVVRIENVPRGEGIAVVFAGPITGILTHWLSGRSHACPGAVKCPVNVHRGRTVWKGYAPIRRWTAVHNAWTASVLEVTEALEEQLRGRPLLGEMWHLMRAGSSKKSAQVCGVFYSCRDEPQLLKPFDVIAPIQRLYHTSEIEFGAVNQMLAKVMVEHVAVAGPLIGNEPAAREPSPPTPDQIEALRKLTGRAKMQFGTNGKTARQTLPQ